VTDDVKADTYNVLFVATHNPVEIKTKLVAHTVGMTETVPDVA